MKNKKKIPKLRIPISDRAPKVEVPKTIYKRKKKHLENYVRIYNESI